VSPSLEQTAPDFIEPVLGWRAWLVVERNGVPRLRSLFVPTIWRPRSELVAECLCPRVLPLPRFLRRPRHDAPGRRCECGVYATDLKTTLRYLRNARGLDDRPLARVLGRVSLWGTVVECDRGWRASHAYPAEIVVPARSLGGDPVVPLGEVALGLGDYGVPVRLVEAGRPKELLEALASERAPEAA
jgi:hypothetical protein